jgi:uncharacterized membrane protein YhaH (DUF805 family)
MDWNYLFLKMDGRINRRPFWLGILAIVVVSVVAAIIDAILGLPRFGANEYSGGTGILGIIVGLALIYPSICLSGKRWHDRDKSAWWILIGLIPIIGWIWALVETGFLAGTRGPNRFGPDPLGGQ